jgi:uncharacterized repeat protein (TIGR01451 family)
MAQTNVATVTNSAEPDSNPGNNTGTATETPKYADLGGDQADRQAAAECRRHDHLHGHAAEQRHRHGDGRRGDRHAPRERDVRIRFTPPEAPRSTPSGTPVTGGIWSVPTIAPGQSLVLTITATAALTGVSYNTVTITKSDVWDPNDANNTSNTPTDPQEADLVVSKTVDNPRPNVGDTVTFTITLDNLGPSTSQNVVVNDLLPSGLDYVSHTASTGSYVSNTGVWTVGNVAAGVTNTLTIVATVKTPASGQPALPQKNTATATSTTPDPNPNQNTGASTVTPKQADLPWSKSSTIPRPRSATRSRSRSAVDNFGPDTATKVVVNDLLPTGVTYVSYSATQGTYVPGHRRLDRRHRDHERLPDPDDPRDGDRPTSGLPPAVTNTATVTGTEYDPDPSNNTDSVTETPQYADLAVDKVVSDATPNVGDTITYTVTLSNKGKDTAAGVTILDQLPAGLQFVSAIPSQGTYDAGTGIWDVGTVDTLFARTLSILATVLAPTSGSAATDDQHGERADERPI